jgi:hypothetical protein
MRFLPLLSSPAEISRAEFSKLLQTSEGESISYTGAGGISGTQSDTQVERATAMGLPRSRVDVPIAKLGLVALITFAAVASITSDRSTSRSSANFDEERGQSSPHYKARNHTTIVQLFRNEKYFLRLERDVLHTMSY